MKKLTNLFFLLTIIAISSCKENFENTFLGCWQNTNNKNDYLTIIKSGESFIIENKDGKLPGNMEGSIINLGVAGNIAYTKENHHLLFHDKEYLKIDDVPRTLSELAQSRIDKFMSQILGIWDEGGNNSTFLDIRMKDNKILAYIISSQGELEGTAECKVNFVNESLEGFGIDKQFDFSILESKKENGEFAGSISAYSNKLWGGYPLVLQKSKNNKISFENIKHSNYPDYITKFIGTWKDKNTSNNGYMVDISYVENDKFRIRECYSGTSSTSGTEYFAKYSDGKIIAVGNSQDFYKYQFPEFRILENGELLHDCGACGPDKLIKTATALPNIQFNPPMNGD